MAPTVLIVDDSTTLRRQVVDTLSKAELNVAEAEDGLQGANAIKAGGVDCVICDINMPNMNGIEMVTEVKQDTRFADLPIIMLTTEGSRDLITEAKEAGACGWIVKPFKPDMLVAAVKRLTGSA